MASASSRNTRRPRSMRSLDPACVVIGVEKRLDKAVPLPTSLEDLLTYLTDRSLSAGERGHHAGGGFHLGRSVRYGDGQPHGLQNGQVGEIVAHERTVSQVDAALLRKLHERVQLFVGSALEQIVHLELL